MFLVFYPFMAAASVLFAILSFIFSVPLAITADSDGNLPKYLRWFQTFDATLDAGWKDGYFPVTGTPTGWQLILLRAAWIRRNPGYTFDLALGVPFVYASSWTIHKWDSATSFFFATGPNGAFNIEGVLWSKVHFKFGWKAWNMFDPATGTWAVKPAWEYGNVPICFTISL